ncbi:hypothetical protein M431DRAFT_363821 [Trichoderma harzianum CBS 226.95]|uniref:Uncharacterized protein n=1 Tax=Trichoderma harzianum CBS 226.95 TaxID=983964 RepID=A0A2T3ZT25_TRIHA|nr:hypothetical protein M431DRAFT_363821 [Trichoderma harzianum CBS 226.95]PTB47948.1 hypothetical protein M431DRAFT_363821 [Trichoderma harzianum CBS 226.95]
MSQPNNGLLTPSSGQEPSQAPRGELELPREYGQPGMISSQATRDTLQRAFPPGAVMPSQNTNRLARIWRSYDDMDPDARRLVDDLLGTLASFNNQELFCNDTVRKNFWDRWVYASGWDTNSTVDHPGKIRERSAAESSVRVGTIKPGMPRSQARVKKNQGTPAHRAAGQPVFLKPHLNWDDYTLAFIYCDIRGSTIHSHWVDLTPGYSSVQARADATLRWDVAECKRVTTHNTMVVAYWARCRLVHWLKDRQPRAQQLSCEGRPSVEVPRTEDHSLLERLRTCCMAVEDLTAFVVEFRSVHAKRSDKTYGKARLDV